MSADESNDKIYDNNTSSKEIKYSISNKPLCDYEKKELNEILDTLIFLDKNKLAVNDKYICGIVGKINNSLKNNSSIFYREETVDLLKKNKDNSYACLCLGIIYDTINIGMSYYYTIMSSELNNIYAVDQLGYWYDINKNKLEKINCLERCSEYGFDKASEELGNIYSKEVGTRNYENEKKAITYYEKIKNKSDEVLYKLFTVSNIDDEILALESVEVQQYFTSRATKYAKELVEERKNYTYISASHWMIDYYMRNYKEKYKYKNKEKEKQNKTYLKNAVMLAVLCGVWPQNFEGLTKAIVEERFDLLINEDDNVQEKIGNAVWYGTCQMMCEEDSSSHLDACKYYERVKNKNKNVTEKLLTAYIENNKYDLVMKYANEYIDNTYEKDSKIMDSLGDIYYDKKYNNIFLAFKCYIFANNNKMITKIFSENEKVIALSIKNLNHSFQQI